MSMDSLAEDVCGICHVRYYRGDLHLVSFNKIPSIELLQIHNDINGVIPQIQRMESSFSNKKVNWNNDIGIALTDDKEKG